MYPKTDSGVNISTLVLDNSLQIEVIQNMGYF